MQWSVQLKRVSYWANNDRTFISKMYAFCLPLNCSLGNLPFAHIKVTSQVVSVHDNCKCICLQNHHLTWLVIRGGNPDLCPTAPDRPGQVRTKCFNVCWVRAGLRRIGTIRGGDCYLIKAGCSYNVPCYEDVNFRVGQVLKKYFNGCRVRVGFSCCSVSHRSGVDSKI